MAELKVDRSGVRSNAFWRSERGVGGIYKEVSKDLSARPITSIDGDRTAKKLAFVCQQSPIWC